MRFFEVSTPYFALLKSESEEAATQSYIDVVSDIDGEKFDIKEVSRDYALAQFSRAPGEDNELLSVSEVLSEFNDANNPVLLVDGHLL